MSEEDQPRRRGRPSNAEIAARAATWNPSEQKAVQPQDMSFPKGQEEEQQRPEREKNDIHGDHERAQQYAMRIWRGQSPDLGRAVRIERVKKALEGQGMSMDGVRLPGGGDSDDDWDEEDSSPVSWRRKPR